MNLNGSGIIHSLQILFYLIQALFIKAWSFWPLAGGDGATPNPVPLNHI
jgi:hypothetical protein